MVLSHPSGNFNTRTDRQGLKAAIAAQGSPISEFVCDDSPHDVTIMGISCVWDVIQNKLGPPDKACRTFLKELLKRLTRILNSIYDYLQRRAMMKLRRRSNNVLHIT
jgi:hypothetical protein